MVPEFAAGAAVGAMALVGIAMAVSVRRKRNNGSNTGAAQHVPELSPMDIAVEIEMGKEAVGSAETVTADTVTEEMPSENGTAAAAAAAATDGDVAAEVAVEDVCPKVDDAASVQQDQRLY